MLREDGYVKDLKDTLVAKNLSDVRKGLCNYIRNIGKSGDFSLLLNMEESIVKNDLFGYANSNAMKRVLKRL
ncbi:hypothetical protein [Bartonella schoenbuchensis]|uniref:hypothetical protein n=1 Tax=Bartonella schoenbuchensis TaxID=165694 RepID=UPI0003A03975|nr:hypothetical protein [Bartonella schoenbuchensis]